MLNNRFNNEVRSNWCNWYSCLLCGENTGNALHHIISPANRLYIKGKHNTSVFNSALLCNFKCHLYNPELFREDTVRKLLSSTKEIMAVQGYVPNERDLEFLKTYSALYE